MYASSRKPCGIHHSCNTIRNDISLEQSWWMPPNFIRSEKSLAKGTRRSERNPFGPMHSDRANERRCLALSNKPAIKYRSYCVQVPKSDDAGILLQYYYNHVCSFFLYTRCGGLAAMVLRC